MKEEEKNSFNRILINDIQLLQDNDFRMKHDSNQVSIVGLKKELDDLRFLLNEKGRVVSDV